MPSLSTSPRRRRDGTKSKFKVVGKYDEFLSRIKKSLYYGKLPTSDRFSLPVTELAAELFSEVKNGQSLERLDLEEAAAMSRNACVSPCSLVLALLYLERLKSCNPDYLQRVAPSELFLVSMMVASKFLHDDGEADEVFNDEWAASAGISVKQVNRFERDFLQAIEWEVFVSEQTFWKRLIRMERDVALKEGKRRGWFSYSDLENLLDTVDFSALAQTVITVSAVCLTSYTASVLTLIGSAFIVSQIPGIPISSSVSSTCNISRTVPQEMPVTNSLEDPTLQVSPSVGVLTSFILASLSSCHSENASITPGFTFGNDKSSACTCPHCPVRNVNIPNGQLIGWTETVLEYLNWQWWQIELKQLFDNHLNETSKSQVQELTQSKHRKYRADDDAANHSELDSHSRRNEKQSNARDGSQDFIMEVQNWLDQAALERSSHTNFFPLKITSNY